MKAHGSTGARDRGLPSRAADSTTRVDLLCTPAAAASARFFVVSWCHDRAVGVDVTDSLALLASEAVTEALRFRPASAAIAIFWQDADLVRLEVTWRGGTAATPQRRGPALRAGALALLDELALDWDCSSESTSGAIWAAVDASPTGSKDHG